ncbi:hypothetical protein L9F63_004639, partial [Diploptera punctata]
MLNLKYTEFRYKCIVPQHRLDTQIYLVTSEGTSEEPLPAVRRKRQHQVLLAAQQPKPPKPFHTLTSSVNDLSNSCKRIEVKASSHDDVQIESMSEFSVKSKCDVQDDDSSYEDAATTVDGIYFNQNSAIRPFSNTNINTNSSSRREKTATLSVPSSPVFIRSTSSSCG